MDSILSLSSDINQDTSFDCVLETFSILSSNSSISSSNPSTSDYGFNEDNEQFSSINALSFLNTKDTNSPVSSASSTSSSLSLPIDPNPSHPPAFTNYANNNFEYCQTASDFEYLNPYVQNNFYMPQINNDQSYNNYNLNYVLKQDVSVGTDVLISSQVYSTKAQNNIRVFRQLDQKESFKLIEKLPSKKCRTKYSKEQIELLENAYSRNNYPDLVTVDHLCKSIGITRDKINIWFQNRRARGKKHGF